MMRSRPKRTRPLPRNRKPLRRTPLKRKRKKPIARKSLRIRPFRRGDKTHTLPDGRVIMSWPDWQKQRIAIYERDGAICQIPKSKDGKFSPIGKPCGGYVRREDYECDHIIPCGMNGANRDDRAENLQCSHRWCNHEKGSRRQTAHQEGNA